jgi:NAD+ synthase
MDCKHEVEGLLEFIKHHVNAARKTSCIIGISGGIDSAVVASLCKMVFPDTTYGISMPTYSNKSESSNRAIEFCFKKDIHIINHPVCFDDICFLNTMSLNKYKDLKLTDKAIGNYLARQRMANLYMYAEMINGLVIGTDNLSENYIGYFTKYGDGGVDINPIGKYFKSEVYELARYLEVPDSIINATPSAELWEGQTDEGELGFTHDQLEKVIRADYDGVPDEIIDKANDMYYASEHKRKTPEEYDRW